MSETPSYPAPKSPHWSTVETLLKSFNTWDLDLTASLLADDYVHRFHPDSVAKIANCPMNKEQYLEQERATKAIVEYLGVCRAQDKTLYTDRRRSGNLWMWWKAKMSS